MMIMFTNNHRQPSRCRTCQYAGQMPSTAQRLEAYLAHDPQHALQLIGSVGFQAGHVTAIDS
jgi:hypothetical protein